MALSYKSSDVSSKTVGACTISLAVAERELHEVALPRFELNNLRYRSYLIIGGRQSGKTKLAQYLAELNFSCCNSSTAKIIVFRHLDANDEWNNAVVYTTTAEALTTEIISTRILPSSLHPTIVVFDLSGPPINKEVIEYIFTSLPSNTVVIFTSQDGMLPPNVRTNIDCICCFANSNNSNRQRLYNYYFGSYSSFYLFSGVMDKIGKRGALVATSDGKNYHINAADALAHAPALQQLTYPSAATADPNITVLFGNGGKVTLQPTERILNGFLIYGESTDLIIKMDRVELKSKRHQYDNKNLHVSHCEMYCPHVAPITIQLTNNTNFIVVMLIGQELLPQQKKLLCASTNPSNQWCRLKFGENDICFRPADGCWTYTDAQLSLSNGLPVVSLTDKVTNVYD